MFSVFFLSIHKKKKSLEGNVIEHVHVIQSQVQVLAQSQLDEVDAAKSSTSGVQRVSTSTLRNSNNGPVFVVSKYGTKQLLLKQHTFNRHVSREDVTYWRCSQFAVLRCRSRIKTKGNTLTVLNGEHNHEVITQARKYGSLKTLKAEQTANAANIASITNVPNDIVKKEMILIE